MNELKIAQRTSRMSIVEDNLFGTSSSVGHCVSSDFFMGAGIAERFAPNSTQKWRPKLPADRHSDQSLHSTTNFQEDGYTT